MLQDYGKHTAFIGVCGSFIDGLTCSQVSNPVEYTREVLTDRARAARRGNKN